MCHCTVLRLNNLPHTIIFWGTKQTVPAKQRKDGALFGTVLNKDKAQQIKH